MVEVEAVMVVVVLAGVVVIVVAARPCTGCIRTSDNISLDSVAGSTAWMQRSECLWNAISHRLILKVSAFTNLHNMVADYQVSQCSRLPPSNGRPSNILYFSCTYLIN